jgi:N-acetylglutamate synthase-like GNAT family acetyltransferase
MDWILNSPEMNASNFRVRRATLDDIGQLIALWKSMHLPADELAKRVTEFQVAESAEGKVVGAVGLQIAERQGRIHSESFTDFAVADQVRPQFWDRVHAVATNHGLLRLWTQEQAPFWAHCGLVKPDEEALGKLPAHWRSHPANWLTLKLKDDIETLISVDKEFALFMESEKQRTARAFQHAKILKGIATIIAVALCVLMFVAFFQLVRRNPHLLGR